MALDIPPLLRRIAGMEDASPSSREYQRIIADEFNKRGDKVSPTAIDRWRQRGSLPTARTLLLLQIAKDRKVPINLLDFATPSERFAQYKAQDKLFKDRRKREIARLRAIAAQREKRRA